MKLLFAVVQNDDVKALTRALIDHDISAVSYTHLTLPTT